MTIDAPETNSVCEPATLTHGWIIICCVSVSFVLARLSIDFIQTASQKTRKHFRESHHAATEEKAAKTKTSATNYGSIQDNKNGDNEAEKDSDATAKETAKLLPSSDDTEAFVPQMCPSFDSSIRNHTSLMSLRFQGILFMALLLVAILPANGGCCILSEGIVWACVTVVAFSLVLNYRDADRQRFGYVARILYLAAVLTITIPITMFYYKNRDSSRSGDEIIVHTMGLYLLLALGECVFVPFSGTRSESGTPLPGDKKLSTSSIATLLKPYVWPDKTADSAVTNRIRACMTWVCVIASKGCNLSAPVLVSRNLHVSEYYLSRLL